MRRALAHRPSRIPPKYFYDMRGSALFDRICELPEYYPTRTELGILADRAGEMAACIGPQAEIVEFGAGSLTKVRLLLDALVAPARYLPIDISGHHLEAAAERLVADYPSLDVVPIVADYTLGVKLPEPLGDGRRVGFFPGSTLGNFSPTEALDFLRRAASLLRGGGLLLGVDLVKSPTQLHAAYNDAAGVTAAFNLNLLQRANDELDSDFDLDAFEHCAFYNAPAQCIEMHLVSRCSQLVCLGAERFQFAEGETMHTENSYKFTIDGLRDMARMAGFEPRAVWTDPARLFSLHWLEAPAP
ncbi:MAG: L-histidine N(alpha)-methyltransferase [Variovorax sp.]